MDGGIPQVQEEGQAPALRDVVWLRIELGQRIREQSLW